MKKASLTARAAATRVIRQQLEIMRQNEPGVLAGTDPEALHDYRVSLRRIRSALSLIKEVYPAGRTRQLKAAFASLGERTNRLRDLDVWLGTRTGYSARIAPELRPGLDDIYDQAQKERDVEFARVCRFLRTKGYERRLASLASFFENADALAPAANSLIAARHLIASSIYQRYRKVRKFRKKLDAQTPGETIHKLRIQGKKLRYLLQFFCGLFPEEKTGSAIKHLRRLQDCLGHYNDCSVQRLLLDSWLEKRQAHAAIAPELTAAAGALKQLLHLDQRAERKQLAALLEDFCAAGVASRFKRFKKTA
jgi:CHAD domain-containing protein